MDARRELDELWRKLVDSLDQRVLAGMIRLRQGDLVAGRSVGLRLDRAETERRKRIAEDGHDQLRCDTKREQRDGQHSRDGQCGQCALARREARYDAAG